MTALATLAQAASFATQSVRRGPHTAAPPSFNGHGWLVVWNLSWMTVTALTAAMVVLKLAGDLWRDRFKRGPLVALLRTMLLIAFGGMMLRTGVEAIVLWGWDPGDPAMTGWYLTLKRLVDPFGAGAYWLSICLFIMTQDALEGSLQRVPYPKRLIAELPKLKRPMQLALLTIIAAIGVVSTR